MPVMLDDAEVRELRSLLHDLDRNPFSSGEIRGMGGLRSVLSRSVLTKLCIQTPENKTAEALYTLGEHT
jgi:hypothetical protein